MQKRLIDEFISFDADVIRFELTEGETGLIDRVAGKYKIVEGLGYVSDEVWDCKTLEENVMPEVLEVDTMTTECFFTDEPTVWSEGYFYKDDKCFLDQKTHEEYLEVKESMET